jgi:formylmethanofuran dehydrogenase subunit E
MSARKVMKDFSAGKILACTECGEKATVIWQTLSGPEPMCEPCSNQRSIEAGQKLQRGKVERNV